MRRYSFVLNNAAFFALGKLKPKHREIFVRLFLRLENDPNFAPDYLHNSVDRELSVIKCAGLSVYYWVDHAVCEIRIIEISK